MLKNLEIGPTGNLIQGNIFDCNKKSFVRALKAYDNQLYLVWNPKKREGLGVWEVWRNPTKKTLVNQGVYEGNTLFTLEYKPNSFEHHVQDLEYLSYNFITRLHEMDMWNNKQFLDQMDQRLEDDQDKLNKSEEESIKYAVKHNKKLFKELAQLTKEGYNPLWFFSDKKQGDGDV